MATLTIAIIGLIISLVILYFMARIALAIAEAFMQIAIKITSFIVTVVFFIAIVIGLAMLNMWLSIFFVVGCIIYRFVIAK